MKTTPAQIIIFCMSLCLIMPPQARGEETLENAALLIIDIQNFYFPEGRLPLAEPEKAGRNAQALLQAFREKGKLVVHVRHNFEPGGEIHADVAPKAGEKVISKDNANAFKDTDLLEFLKANEIKTVVICGMQTHMCVEAGARAASDLDFEVIVAHDACATRALKFGDLEVSAQDVHASTLSALSGSYAEVVDTVAILKRL
ncbi:MAG: cysteine hydrolase family protein [Candidatus Aminicenantaceae bacterium]